MSACICVQNGKNNGTVGGHEYFTCPKGHGVFVAPGKVTLLGAKPKKETIMCSVPTPLGMSFDGTPELGYYILKIKPGSNAEQSGTLAVGHRFVKVNGKPVKGIQKADVVALIKASLWAMLCYATNNFDRCINYHPQAVGAMRVAFAVLCVGNINSTGSALADMYMHRRQSHV